MTEMIYTAIRRMDGNLLAVTFETRFAELVEANTFATAFPKSAGMSGYIDYDADGERYALALSVCRMEPTTKNPGASKTGLSQFRAVMRTAHQLIGTSMPELRITYSPQNSRSPHTNTISTTERSEERRVGKERRARRATTR